jgi:hypothetical protein
MNEQKGLLTRLGHRLSQWDAEWHAVALQRKAVPQWVSSLVITFMCLVALLGLIAVGALEGGSEVRAAVAADAGQQSPLQCEM